MSWVTVIWSMAAATSLTLAAVHLLVWLRDRAAIANLLFAVSALAAAALAMQELVAMRAQTPGEFEVVLRWMHVSTAIIVVAVVWFIRRYLGTGRVWLAWFLTGLRGVILLINFFAFPNATFREIYSLREVYFLGEALSAPIGEENPWRLLIHLSLALLLIYVLDAVIAAWKLGKKRQALVLGTAILAAIVLGAIFSGLMVHGILPGPLIALVFLVIVGAMAFELSVELLSVKKLSRDLRESEERMRLAARAADLGFWDWDIKRDEVWLDDIGKDRTGTAGRGLAGSEHYLSMVHPEDRDRLRRALEQAIDLNEDFEAEFRMIHEGGGERWITASGQVERGAQGEPLRLRGISMDITDRKQFEAELQRHRSALGHTQRTVAMGQLSAALAHELNQPLGAILRNAEAGELFLRQDPADLDELREIFVDIQRDDHRAAELIDRMRSLLRHRELQFEVIALQELVGEVAGLLTSEMQAREVALHTTIPSKLPEVSGDRVHLQQVLVNLVLNSLDALDARANDFRRIDISAVEVEGGLVEVAVKDTGNGIEPDILQDLFELFVTTKSDGTGIGLAISKTIVEAHGGRIRAENNPGGGACIRFTLPVARPEVAT
jgi:PAS domain S-box-containing protein